MRRNFGLHLFLLLILTLCLLAGAASAADDKKPGELYGDLDGLFSWYYATGSLPEGASLRENSSHLSALYAKNGAAPDGADAAGLERITYCCLEFVSGDKALNDAVLLSVERKGTINPATMADERYLSVDVRINNAVLVTPGSAVFRLTLESASFRFVKDYTLRVFSPEDVPAITYVAPAPRFHCPFHSVGGFQKLLRQQQSSLPVLRRFRVRKPGFRPGRRSPAEYGFRARLRSVSAGNEVLCFQPGMDPAL